MRGRRTMWQGLKIADKIRISFGILILGYFCSMLYGFIVGGSTETRLQTVSESMFPAAISSQSALSTFNELTKLFNDAVMLGDTEMLSQSKGKSIEIQKALESISALKGRTEKEIEDQHLLLKTFSEYIDLAYATYSTIVNQGGNESSETGSRVKQLNNLKDTLDANLNSLVHNSANALKNELTSIGKETKNLRFMNMLIFVCVVFAAIIIVSIIVNRSISVPLMNTVTMVKDIAQGEGDLTKRLQIVNKDEVGELSQWFNVFIDHLQTMIRNIAVNADSVHKASTDLSDLSTLVSEGADQMSAKANQVSKSADDMNTNMNSVAAAMEQASANTNLVASATEEMTGTIGEIANNSEKARAITDKAVAQAKTASDRVKELGTAAQDIGKVTETITEISEQTNLLSLNATIEAARAGEAGKGFAVVANEIKELARQTAEATQDIKAKVEGIQSSTAGTVSDIETISNVINEVNEIVATIAASIEEQSSTTNEIAQNIVHLSSGIRDVNSNVAQSSEFSGQIATDIAEVNHSASDMSNSSSQMNLNTERLKDLSVQLKIMVEKFKV